MCSIVGFVCLVATGLAETVFFDKGDYQAFIQVMIESTRMWNLRISAYCLMPNHYHLLVQTPDANIARCMRHINGVYTQRFNVRHRSEGPLFKGRYKSILVGGDAHLLQLYQAGRIHYEDLITKAQDPNGVVQRLEELASTKRKR